MELGREPSRRRKRVESQGRSSFVVHFAQILGRKGRIFFAKMHTGSYADMGNGHLFTRQRGNER